MLRTTFCFKWDGALRNLKHDPFFTPVHCIALLYWNINQKSWNISDQPGFSIEIFGLLVEKLGISILDYGPKCEHLGISVEKTWNITENPRFCPIFQVFHLIKNLGISIANLGILAIFLKSWFLVQNASHKCVKVIGNDFLFPCMSPESKLGGKNKASTFFEDCLMPSICSFVKKTLPRSYILAFVPHQIPFVYMLQS